MNERKRRFEALQESWRTHWNTQLTMFKEQEARLKEQLEATGNAIFVCESSIRNIENSKKIVQALEKAVDKSLKKLKEDMK